jgi:hypothetical protein
MDPTTHRVRPPRIKSRDILKRSGKHGVVPVSAIMLTSFTRSSSLLLARTLERIRANPRNPGVNIFHCWRWGGKWSHRSHAGREASDIPFFLTICSVFRLPETQYRFLEKGLPLPRVPSLAQASAGPVESSSMAGKTVSCLRKSRRAYYFLPGTASGSIPYKSLKDGTLRSAGIGW